MTCLRKCVQMRKANTLDYWSKKFQVQITILKVETRVRLSGRHITSTHLRKIREVECTEDAYFTS